MSLLKDKQIFLRSKKVWEKNYKLFPGTKLNFPNENLVRIFCGNYVKVPLPPARIMDHGFGDGNNLAFFSSKGYKCSGCEISEYFIEMVKEYFRSIKKRIDLRQIKGQKIPFASNNFDIVVSWNAIHYIGMRKAVEKIISEIYRVLKPGGVLLLSTISPKSVILKRMENLGNGSYLIQKKSNYDNREGLTYFVAKSPKDLTSLFNKFSEVKSGSVSSDLFKPLRRIDCLLIYAVK